MGNKIDPKWFLNGVCIHDEGSKTFRSYPEFDHSNTKTGISLN
ncbi:hypothetical protein AQPE_3067 [Aquipluma nitroreducens]|uniref:Uncharacterized protein n=1 Tax=Aquipluma nitroreducens TaxID=2010828 RepID=A0A5K7SBR0_9BACT|nr:hypothetical protein AQPE_3067 [Aquipluma nitroreducens]